MESYLFIFLALLYSVVSSENACNPNPCGPFSKCIDDPSNQKVAEVGPYCICESNTYGYPPYCQMKLSQDDSCKPDEYFDINTKTCEKGCRYDHSTCKSDEFCSEISHQCEKGCRLNSENCADDEVCDFETQECISGCRSDESCAATEFCDFFSRQCEKGCRSDDNCGHNEYCDFNAQTCMKGCGSDDSCAFDKYCNPITRRCSKGCRANGDNCDDSEFCVEQTRKCKPGCKYDADCSANEFCNEQNKCVKLCDAAKCGPNAKCVVRQQHSFCLCDDGYIPQKHVGCRLRKANETGVEFRPHKNRTKFCSQFCAEGSSCGFLNKKFYCTCYYSKNSNPILKCEDSFGSRPSDSVCDCCEEHKTPGCEVPIGNFLLRKIALKRRN